MAIAETFRGDGEILVSPIGNLPQIGARLAKLTFEPDILLTDGVAYLVANVMPVGGAEGPEPIVEGYMPYRTVFDTLWSGRRHVMMGATQIDRFGNQNIACIGDFAKPKVAAPGHARRPGQHDQPPHQLLDSEPRPEGLRREGRRRERASATTAPRSWARRRRASTRSAGSCRTWVSSISRRRIASCASPRCIRVSTVEQVVENTGFELVTDGDVPETRAPTDEELRLIREGIDPKRDSRQRDQGVSQESIPPCPPASTPRSAISSTVRYPIIQTGMGWVATPELSAAVSNAGAFGFLAAATIRPEEVDGEIEKVQGSSPTGPSA